MNFELRGIHNVKDFVESEKEKDATVNFIGTKGASINYVTRGEGLIEKGVTKTSRREGGGSEI